MTLPESMFLFEITVEELKSCICCKEFYIRSQFANVFMLNLKDPNEHQSVFPKRLKKKKLKKRAAEKNIRKFKKSQLVTKVRHGQSVLFTTTIDSLISNMRLYPMELFLWKKDNPEDIIGSTSVRWSSLHIDYLNKLRRKRESVPVTVKGEYKVFNELTSKCMATIKLNMKLSCLKDKFITQNRSLSQGNQNTFLYTRFQSPPAMILNSVRDKKLELAEETGLIKTIYSNGNRRTSRPAPKSILNSKGRDKQMSKDNEMITSEDLQNSDPQELYEPVQSFNSLIKSATYINNNKQIDVIKSKSFSSISCDHYKILDYIFGDDKRPFGNKVYYVGYFTVENDFNKNTESSKESLKGQSSEKSTTESQNKYKLRFCGSDCPRKPDEVSCSKSLCSSDLPEEAADLINMTKCEHVECDNKKHRELPSPPDDRILLNISNVGKQCCDKSEKVEQVVGEMKAKMKFEGDPCYCSCECTFGFTKKTTYCTVCGGYETIGEDIPNKPRHDKPYPCPIFHKLVDKNKLKTWSTSGSESRKKLDESQRSFKVGAKSGASEKRSTGDKSVESERDSKKSKKKEKKDDRFKFNYGYQGIPPQIGHSRCAFPCTGTLGAVPKNMGWLWTAENIPGMKFRPLWRPGATNKHVVRMLKIARNPDEAISKKKKRKDTGKKKPLKRPLLVVHKKDGEYTVTMETMKIYPKPRAINQIPFEDKPLLTYTIGRTEEENRERQKRKDREHRRLERAQRQFIQSAFTDVCREICLKTYQQALGLLPEAEDPNCPCYSAPPDGDKGTQDVSCSCSEEKISFGSDTDSDEWIVEFTPPNALFDPTFKSKKVVKLDNSSQYNYLDYRVKLLDRYGNPVPRFFRGPDGRQQCSDLGGFWGPGHKWLEINVDGYVAPDERWAPNTFIGPNGEQVDTDTGKFQAANGNWLVVGIHGYIDSQGKWVYYPKPRNAVFKKKRRAEGGKKGIPDNVNKVTNKPISESTWSCFGDATPKQLSKMGIVGHGQDKKLLLSTLRDLMAQGEDVRLPQPSVVPRYQQNKMKNKRGVKGPSTFDSRTYFSERSKCKHPVPSEKGVVAVDDHGNKTYFRMKDVHNRRPKDRLHELKHRGISLSTFHVPCFRSFINSEIMKKEQMERLIAMSAKSTKCISTQIG